MPLFRIDTQLHYFAHVPKCGGTSVELYLEERFGELGFRDRGFLDRAEADRWSQSSPQHTPAEVFRSLIPERWVSSSFAVVRHPVRRLVSAFTYARDVRKTLPAGTLLDDWCQAELAGIVKEPFLHDGHFLPQSVFVPEGARVFRLEDGLQSVVDHLDRLAGNSRGPRTLPEKNVAAWRSDPSARPPDPAPATLALIATVYADDFDRFGYDRPHAGTAAGIPDISGEVQRHLASPRRRTTLERLSNSIRKRIRAR